MPALRYTLLFFSICRARQSCPPGLEWPFSESYATLKSPISDVPDRSDANKLEFLFRDGDCCTHQWPVWLKLNRNVMDSMETWSPSYCTKKFALVSASRRNHNPSLVYVRTYIQFIQVSTLRQAQKYGCQWTASRVNVWWTDARVSYPNRNQSNKLASLAKMSTLL